ncbi:integral membrane protein GPR137C [Varanus komodoensis]|uniref:integral membrane protein GPR137C n=1 Tax=Varanus komodoensis TaxID=61221 RepID=UPI001CF77D08|nr:integral membrane protein GPR137C [Varanus komodoensis]
MKGEAEPRRLSDRARQPAGAALGRRVGGAPRRPMGSGAWPGASASKPGGAQLIGAAGGPDPRAPLPAALPLGLSLLHALLYGGLFLFAYLQLWLLFCYRERRLSYRSVCLFLCLLWAALRTVLFCAYLQSALRAGPLRLPPFPRWLLFCLPVCLLFATVCLLALYFAEVIFKVKCAAEFNKYRALLYAGSIFTSLLFVCVNLTCTLLARDDVPEDQLRWTLLARALINDSLFIFGAVLLAFCMCKLSKMSSANVYLESKGTSVCQALLVGSVVILLYSSRAFYNLVAVAISPDRVPSPFNYGWDNLSDQVRGEEVGSEEFVVFGVVLFLWEFVPTTFMLLFFRAQRLTQNLAPAGMINSHSYSSRAYFFDNPRRYDSDDDLPRLSGGSLSTPPNAGWYGSLTGSESCSAAPALAVPPRDVPPLLFSHGSLESRSQPNGHLSAQN